MHTIRIERNSEWNNKARTIGIYIDGEVAGTIDDGETKEFMVASGKHEIHAKIDWCRSPKIEWIVSENETTSLKLRGFKYGTWIFPALLGISLVYYLGKYALNMNLSFLIWILAIGFLYPLYFITFGKNKYLRLTKNNKTY
ncbi:hypothetical protein FG167_01180 [Lacinutrix sp. WUR7]|uniref:hypothetical protein n=1 Tax=Lacinutrix sp. WUR7 TaxID=2653681 RepID=UPI00193DF82D|nr:hypothetical protein [Lacinutrix sp. WUR7]QRM87890.1 hypothetical protein FG167_01180 [Lacinutrix sp. WUR7]